MRRNSQLLALLFGAAVLLSACGGGDDEAATADATTSTTEAIVEAEAESDAESDAAEPAETTTTEASETTTTEAPETTTTTEAPQATTAPAGNAGPNSFGGVSDLGAVLAAGGPDLSDDEASCITDGTSALGSDFDGLAPEEQAVALEVSIECAPDALRAVFVGGFSNPDIDGDNLLDSFGPEIGECLYDEILVDDDDQPNRISALVFAGRELPAPDAAIEPGSAMMATCVDFGELFVEAFGSDPALEGAINFDCIDTSFDTETTQEIFAGLLMDPDGFTDGDAPDALDAVLGCVEFGQVLAAELGVELSDDEISCINEAFRDLRATGSAGDLGEDQLGGLFTCLDPENLAALFAGG